MRNLVLLLSSESPDLFDFLGVRDNLVQNTAKEVGLGIFRFHAGLGGVFAELGGGRVSGRLHWVVRTGRGVGRAGEEEVLVHSLVRDLAGDAHCAQIFGKQID
jgi:hypothetical protein